MQNFRCVDAIAESVGDHLDHRQVHVVLGLEVLEEAALGEADGFRHVVQADARQPTQRRLAGRLLEDARPRRLALFQRGQASLLDKVTDRALFEA